MKSKIILLIICLLTCQINEIYAKNKKDKIDYNFKIVGSKKIKNLHGTKTVMYDPVSPDHLIINFDLSNGLKYNSKRYLFTGEKFSLKEYYSVESKKGLFVLDGEEKIYNQKGILNYINHRINDSIAGVSRYYPSGQIKIYIPGNKIKNGEYKMWYKNGQVSFVGNYINNSKEGVFKAFDTDGKLIREGMYKKGVLVEGVAVVQDKVYEDPEVPASFSYKGMNFDQYLTERAKTKAIPSYFWKGKEFHYALTYDETGKLIQVMNHAGIEGSERTAVYSLFIKLPGITPAYVESVPVKSREHIWVNFKDDKVWIEPYVRPTKDTPIEPAEFPGGKEALRVFIGKSIEYPLVAVQQGIQGKVYVRYVINPQGDVCEVRIAKGVHPLIDKEAVRVVKSMPKHKPATQNGKPITVSYTVPINFKLGS